MKRREKLIQLTESNLTFLSDKFDAALLGSVDTANDSITAYGYQAIKAILRKEYKDPKAMYAHMQMLNVQIRNIPNIMIVHRLSRKELWNQINELNLPSWEQLNTAVIGLGYIQGSLTGVVYNKTLCVQKLLENQSLSGVNGMLDTIKYLEDRVISIHLGDYTPGFLTPL